MNEVKPLTEKDVRDIFAAYNYAAELRALFAMKKHNLAFESPRPSLQEYREQLGEKICRWCNVVLPMEVLHYPHEYGWAVRGYAHKQWLFLRCVNCNYAWNLEKLGLPRPH